MPAIQSIQFYSARVFNGTACLAIMRLTACMYNSIHINICVYVCVSVKLIKRFLCCSGGCAKLFAEIQLAAGNFSFYFWWFFYILLCFGWLLWQIFGKLHFDVFIVDDINYSSHIRALCIKYMQWYWCSLKLCMCVCVLLFNSWIMNRRHIFHLPTIASMKYGNIQRFKFHLTKM